MPTFAVNRQSQNRGCGVRSGRWLYEGFMFGDSCFGRSEVEYTPRHGSSTTEIEDIKIGTLVIGDDEGEDIPLSEEDYKKASSIVLEAFMSEIEDVVAYEQSLK